MRGPARTANRFLTLSRLPQQVGQLGDIGRDPSRLVRNRGTAFALRNEKPRSRCCVGRRPEQWASCGGRPDDNMAGDSVTERLTAPSTYQGRGKGKRRATAFAIDAGVDKLRAQGWEIAGYASGYDNRTSLILFRHSGVNVLVQCGILYDVTRTPRTLLRAAVRP